MLMSLRGGGMNLSHLSSFGQCIFYALESTAPEVKLACPPTGLTTQIRIRVGNNPVMT